MSGINDQERLEELRKRLYARGGKIESRKPYKIPPAEVSKKAASTWEKPPVPKSQPVSEKPVVATEAASVSVAAPTPLKPVLEPVPAADPKAALPSVTESSEPALSSESAILEVPMAPKKRSRRYRLKILLAAAGFFVLAMAVSSGLFLMGGNSISGENITISLTGPFTIGGGETIPLQLGITNDNSVPIESATLIVEYPQGTKSATEEGGEMYIERLPLETIGSGETVNIPLRAVVFGEENAEKMIEASVEYRVEGSNATFFKAADPLRFKISSSPVVLQINSNTKISSGQQTTIELKITSNSPTPLNDVLVKAEYPTGFDFVESRPDPAANSNTWLIKTLDPQETVTIAIDTIIVGKESDELAAHFSVGVPREQDAFSLASTYISDSVEFEIEQPFLDISFGVGRSDTGTEVTTAGQPVTMAIQFENSLNDTLYDAVVTVELSGNAVSDMEVGPPNGFYDSSRNLITWDSSNSGDLATILPGDENRLTFTLTPDSSITRTPQVNMKVSVKARRVSENRVPEELVGTAEGMIRVATSPKLLSESRYSVGSFTGSGPIPPVAEETTVYTLSMLIDNGTNQITDAEVTATLPTYVNWLNESGGDGKVTYNSTTRALTWRTSEVEANKSAQTSFQVSILPSVTQIDTTPTLMSEQRLKATDQFTGSTVRATRNAVTTELSTEAGYESGNGRVIQ